ncbi:MAG: 1-acyl-sn-glycerol-3-phosphate acyltransferase [Polyangiaceae bacterium]|nr:1-acyl-sn-glycerol-3-phosphate acyltransferase [Polyangiaceae bacterium]
MGSVVDTDLSVLTPVERAALRLGAIVNERAQVKRAARAFNEAFTGRWMSFVTSRRMRVFGLEAMRALAPNRGVVLAANHRTFFDLYVTLTHLHREVSWCERTYFPVRSEFWYDHPLGVLTNVLASGMSMYPPVYRETEKRGVTRVGLDFLAEELRRPGTVVGIHPEGKRGKGPDPYELLPAEPGFGRVVLGAEPIVVPVFVHGMTNAFVSECRSNFDGTGVPILVLFGEPVELGDLFGGDPTRLRAQVTVGRRVLDAIARLAERERAERAAIGRG